MSILLGKRQLALETKNASPNNAGASRALFAMASRNSERTIIPINDSAARKDCTSPAFYCIHSISGAVGSDFVQLARQIEPAVRFFGVQAPPKMVRDPAFGATVESIAAYYCDAIGQQQPSGSILLGGWSAGAAIALEMAQMFRARGRDVGLLVALDGAPENTKGPLAAWDPRYLWAFGIGLYGWCLGAGLPEKTLKAIAQRLTKTAIGFGARVAARATGTSRAALGHPVEGFLDYGRYPPEQGRFMVRLYDAIMAHKPSAYSGPVVVYEAKLNAPRPLPQFGRAWRKIAPQAQIVPINGNHLTIVSEPQVTELALNLRTRLSAFAQVDGSEANQVAAPRPSFGAAIGFDLARISKPARQPTSGKARPHLAGVMRP